MLANRRPLLGAQRLSRWNFGRRHEAAAQNLRWRLSRERAPLAFPGLPGHDPNLAHARRSAEAIGRAMTELRPVAPNAESNFFERNWQQAFWGSNYPRLLSVKKRYDPHGLFFVHHGAGSEAWSPDGFTRRV